MFLQLHIDCCKFESLHAVLRWQDEVAQLREAAAAAAAVQPVPSASQPDDSALAGLRGELAAACLERDHAKQQLSRWASVYSSKSWGLRFHCAGFQEVAAEPGMLAEIPRQMIRPERQMKGLSKGLLQS